MLIKIFCCYDTKDEQFLAELETWLKQLERSGQVSVWHEKKILSGTNQTNETEKRLRESDIVLLLVSPDFLASDHCYTIQQQAMEFLKKHKISSVIPLIIRPSDWKQESIGELKPLPKNEQPISTWIDKDEAWLDVGKGIKDVIEFLLTQPDQPSDVKEGFSFIGLHPANGYRWDYDLRPAPGLEEQKDLPEAPWLVSQAVGILELAHRYSIFEESNILRDFATLSPTAEAVKRFADRYGNLGKFVRLIYPEKVGQPDSILWAGEPLQFWVQEIEKMNILVTLWDMIRNRQIEALREYIVWQLDPFGVFFKWKSRSGIPRAVISSKGVQPYLLNQWEWGEVIRPALHYLIDKINELLEGHVNPRLFITQKNEIDMYMTPDCLRSALYILLLMELKELSIEPG